MTRGVTFMAAGLLLLGTTAPAEAAGVNLTLAVADDERPGRVTYVVGIEGDGGGPVDLNGYTLDFDFDARELRFVEARQLVRFGSTGIPGFSYAARCRAGRCTAGNVPGQDARGVRQLLSITFHVLKPVDDGAGDFVVGILDPVFDGITQATGQAPLELGITRLEAAVDRRPARLGAPRR